MFIAVDYELCEVYVFMYIRCSSKLEWILNRKREQWIDIGDLDLSLTPLLGTKYRWCSISTIHNRPVTIETKIKRSCFAQESSSLALIQQKKKAMVVVLELCLYILLKMGERAIICKSLVYHYWVIILVKINFSYVVDFIKFYQIKSLSSRTAKLIRVAIFFLELLPTTIIYF